MNDHLNDIIHAGMLITNINTYRILPKKMTYLNKQTDFNHKSIVLENSECSLFIDVKVHKVKIDKEGGN